MKVPVKYEAAFLPHKDSFWFFLQYYLLSFFSEKSECRNNTAQTGIPEGEHMKKEIIL